MKRYLCRYWKGICADIIERIKSYEIHGLSTNKILKYVDDYPGNGLKSIYTFLKKVLQKVILFWKKYCKKVIKNLKLILYLKL